MDNDYFDPFGSSGDNSNQDFTSDENNAQSDTEINTNSDNSVHEQKEEYVYTPNVPPFNGYQNTYGQPEFYRPEKPAKKSGITSKIVISSIISAIIASLITCTVFMFGSNIGLNTILGGKSDKTTNIVVDSSAENPAQAVAEKVGPSVVGVVVTSSVNNFFFGNTQQQSQGSGIIYSSDGVVITNYHVIQAAVEGNGKLDVYLPSDLDTGIEASVIGYDVSADIAVIKINKSGLSAIETGDSSNLKLGQTAIAIGNPGGMEFYGSISQGIISGLNRTIQLESSSSVKLIQTDAAINPGNSGGALVDIQGKLIGVNSAKLASDGYEGMGFAIPVNDVVSICDRIINKQGQPKPYLGIELSSYYTAEILQQMGYPAGVVVTEVAENSPADEAGIERGDIITEFNGVAVSGVTQYNSEKDKYSPGEAINLTIYRQGKSYTAKLTLGTANS